MQPSITQDTVRAQGCLMSRLKSILAPSSPSYKPPARVVAGIRLQLSNHHQLSQQINNTHRYVQHKPAKSAAGSFQQCKNYTYRSFLFHVLSLSLSFFLFSISFPLSFFFLLFLVLFYFISLSLSMSLSLCLFLFTFPSLSFSLSLSPSLFQVLFLS